MYDQSRLRTRQVCFCLAAVRLHTSPRHEEAKDRAIVLGSVSAGSSIEPPVGACTSVAQGLLPSLPSKRCSVVSVPFAVILKTVPQPRSVRLTIAADTLFQFAFISELSPLQTTFRFRRKVAKYISPWEAGEI